MRPNVTTQQEAINYLRRHHAKPGAVEAAFAFDGDSGAMLDFAEGTPESVDLDESKFQHSGTHCGQPVHNLYVDETIRVAAEASMAHLALRGLDKPCR